MHYTQQLCTNYTTFTATWCSNTPATCAAPRITLTHTGKLPNRFKTRHDDTAIQTACKTPLQPLEPKHCNSGLSASALYLSRKNAALDTPRIGVTQ